VVVSATEWAASDSTAAEPEITPASAFANATARLARPATITVPTLCEPCELAGLSGLFEPCALCPSSGRCAGSAMKSA
jgi:hypothetical protein